MLAVVIKVKALGMNRGLIWGVSKGAYYRDLLPEGRVKLDENCSFDACMTKIS
jgi:hypothetical protein